MYYADRPLFASPYEQRRLQVLCALYAALGRCGMRSTLSGDDPSDFGAYVGINTSHSRWTIRSSRHVQDIAMATICCVPHPKN